MKFNINKDLFLKNINTASEVAVSRNMVSLYNNILISSKNGNLVLKASDLKSTFETYLEAEVIEEGEVLVSTHKLNDFLKVINAKDLTVELGDKNHILVYPKDEKEKVNFSLKCNNVNDFKVPSIKELTLDYIEIEVKNFLKAIGNTIISVSTDTSRHYNMSGVYFNITEDKVELVSTDSRRMGYVEFNKYPSIEAKNAIIPTKVLNLIRKNINNEEKLSIALDNDLFYVKIGNTFLSSEVIDGSYPNYKKIIPEKNTYRVELTNTNLQTALKQVSIASDQNTKKVILKINSDSILLTSYNDNDSEVEAKAKISIESNIESEQIIALNHSFLLDSLRAIEKEAIVFEFENNNRPVVLKSLEEEQDIKILHIVMTMQMN